MFAFINAFVCRAHLFSLLFMLGYFLYNAFCCFYVHKKNLSERSMSYLEK